MKKTSPRKLKKLGHQIKTWLCEQKLDHTDKKTWPYNKKTSTGRTTNKLGQYGIVNCLLALVNWSSGLIFSHIFQTNLWSIRFESDEKNYPGKVFSMYGQVFWLYSRGWQNRKKKDITSILDVNEAGNLISEGFRMVAQKLSEMCKVLCFRHELLCMYQMHLYKEISRDS